MQRRTFLRSSAAGIGLAGAHWLRVPKLVRADDKPAAAGDGTGHLYELTSRPANYESTRDTFTMRVTPVERFYIRNHFDIPTSDMKDWKLELKGLIAKPATFTLADLEKMKQ